MSSSALQQPFLFPAFQLSERLLQFIWNLGYFNSSDLRLVTGESIELLQRGTLNKDQGPDISNGRIRIGETILAGSIELHLKTSDWRRHRHEADSRYTNVILHVVFEHDENVNSIPVLELSYRISTLLLNRYAQFMNTQSGIACGAGLSNANEMVWLAWKERLLAERLNRKASHVLNLLQTADNSWEEVCWWLIARGFGGKVNGDAFEALASSLPLNLLAKHRHSIHQVEALLFGQAGLLTEDFNDPYPQMLSREYAFFQKKYNLQQASVPILFLRMRPGSFPTIRMAQLAVLLVSSHHLFSTIVEAQHLPELSKRFELTANDFWHYHYTFQQASAYKPKTFGQDSIEHLLINTIAPLLFAYGLYHGLEHQKAKALRWLEEVPAEKNAIINEFKRYGIGCSTAFDTQALLELRNSYCATKRCLDCAVGASLLREAATIYNTTNS